MNPYTYKKFDEAIFSATGDSRYNTTINTPSYYVTPIIVRGSGIAGTRLIIGSEVTGTKTNEKVSVINRDGSDYASYYFVITASGKWINYVDLQDLGGGKYKVTGAGYPYNPEWWIDTNRNGTIIPTGYSLLGSEENIKVSTNGLSSYETKKFLKTVIDGETVYVPFENVVKKGSRDAGSYTPTNTTPLTVDLSSGLGTGNISGGTGGGPGSQNTNPQLDTGEGVSKAGLAGNIIGTVLIIGLLIGIFRTMK